MTILSTRPENSKPKGLILSMQLGDAMPRNSHPATESHNHVQKVIELASCLLFMQLDPEPISFYVQHCEWCGIFKGAFCNCDPVVSMVPPGFHRIRNLMLQRAKELKRMGL